MEKTVAIAQSLFPNSYSNLENGKIPYGHGLKSRFEVEEKSILAIEGGNIKFWISDNQNGAFIGTSSILFTLQNLAENRYFST